MYVCYFAENNETYLETTFKGKKVEPEVVIDGLVQGKDYTVTYVNNEKPGEARAELRESAIIKDRKHYILLFTENYRLRIQ